MCGIGGAALRAGANFDVASWMNAMSHRGPDGDGYQIIPPPAGRSGGSVALGHKRLSILDLSDRAAQPMESSCGRYWLTFNGEIYNYRELRNELIAQRREFSSDGDSAVLLAGLVHEGVSFVRRAVGMFAFAFFDRTAQRLYLGRDFFAMKPLYWARFRDGVAFASEINGFFDLPGIDTDLHAQNVFDYLRHGFTDEVAGTLTRGILQVPPGAIVTIDTQAAQVISEEIIWQPARPRTPTLINYEDAKAEFRAAFIESVAMHMRSDVPVSVAVSGGLDSSSVLAVMRHIDPTLPITAFSFIVPGAPMNEERWADIAVQAAGAKHRKFEVKAEEVLALIPMLLERQGEPVGGLSVLAQHCLYRRVHESGIKVILEGQGADEMFGGYTSYVGPRVGSALREGRLIDAARTAWNTPSAAGVTRIDVAKYILQDLVPTGLLGKARGAGGKTLVPDWINTQWLRDSGVVTTRFSGDRSKLASLLEVLDYDVKHLLPRLLRYGDRNSMTSSVEGRLPFLTPRLATLALAMPDDFLFGSDGRPKRLIRDAMRGLVPDAIIDRRDKIGFEPPHAAWLRMLAAWVDDVIASGTDHPAIDMAALNATWTRCKAGEHVNADHLWRPINFLAWLRLRKSPASRLVPAQRTPAIITDSPAVQPLQTSRTASITRPCVASSR